jgi:signal transduction histidine kinase
LKRKHTRLIPYEIASLLVDIFYAKTNFPTIIFETRLRENASKDHCLIHFSPFCKYIFEIGLGEKCRTCHKDRAFDLGCNGITTCWLGLHNIKSQIKFEGEVVAVLLFGQRLINDENRLKNSKEVFQKALNKLDIPYEDEVKIKQLYNQIEHVDYDSMTNQAESIEHISSWIYEMVNQKIQFEKKTQYAYHELAAYLQATLADAENFMMQIDNFSPYKEQAKQVVFSIERMNVVVQNFGGFLGDYYLKETSLTDIIKRSVEMYMVLAKRKGIDIIIYNKDSRDFPTILGSERHLEFAFSNIIHNAVKYSFKGWHRRISDPIEVEIFGQYTQNGYELSIRNFGVGILANEIDTGKIFEHGYRGILARGEYRTGGGAGLGATREVMIAHDIKIVLDSVCTQKDQRQASSKFSYKELEGVPHITTVHLSIPMGIIK